MQRSIIFCASGQNESAMETMGDDSTYEGGYMHESLIWFVEVRRPWMRRTTLEFVASAVSR